MATLYIDMGKNLRPIPMAPLPDDGRPGPEFLNLVEKLFIESIRVIGIPPTIILRGHAEVKESEEEETFCPLRRIISIEDNSAFDSEAAGEQFEEACRNAWLLQYAGEKPLMLEDRKS